MNLLVSILTIICTPLFTVLGIVISENASTKRKRIEVDAESDKNTFASLMAKIDALVKKVDYQGDGINELMAKHQQMAMMIDVLSERVEKHNNVIERTYALEKVVAVLDNREKVSEHRLDDLEKA